MENCRIILRKEWYKKNGVTKCGYTPVLETLGKSVLLKTIAKRDFYTLQDLAKDGTIPVVEVNTEATAKDLDHK